MLNQVGLPNPIAGHKYYGSRMVNTLGKTISAADCRFEYFYTDGLDKNYVFALNSRYV